MDTESVFDKRKSLALKGIAIVLLMFHHTFGSTKYYTGYEISFWPFDEMQVVNFASALKIVVSIFAFISGYGLFQSYEKSKESAINWCAIRYIKTFSNYWFIWIITAVVYQIVDGFATRKMFVDGRYCGVFYILIDFLGLAELFNTPKLIGYAWYMSAAAVFIILIPLLYKHRDELGFILVMHVVFLRVIFPHNMNDYFPGKTTIYAFVTPFLLGCLFARYGWVERWCLIGRNKPHIKAYKCITEM